MQRKPTKLTFEGFNVVLLPDECTREAIRLYRGGGMIAVLQRNGNVGLHRTGLFDNPHNPRPQLRAATCLHGLKLISAEMLARYRDRYELAERDGDVGRLLSEAEDLGFKLVKLPKPKTVGVRKRGAK